MGSFSRLKLSVGGVIKFRGIALLALLFAIFSTPAPSSAGEVIVLLDPNIRPYVEALAGFKESSNAQVKIFNRKENGELSDERALIGAIRARNPDQVLVIGGEAMAALAGEIEDIPILFSMVLSPQDKLKKSYENLTGVAMNVAPEQQMAILDALMPEARHIGVVYQAEESESLVKAGQKALDKQSKQLDAVAVSTQKDAIMHLKMALDQNAAYWMIPDRLMRSRELIRYLFFASKDKKKALIGLSDKYVRAGALFALSVQNRQLGRQVGQLSNRILDGKKPSQMPIEMAQDAELSINTKVAESLGIKVSNELLQQAKHIY